MEQAQTELSWRERGRLWLRLSIRILLLTAVVLGALVLGEVMTPVQLTGACCIIGGALVGEARVKLPAAQRRRMRRAYVRLVRAQRHVLHHAA